MRRHSLVPVRPMASSRPLPHWVPIGLVAVLSLPALWPFYAEGLPRSFDGGLHLLRIALLHRHVVAGDLFPRWVPEQILGHGYPLFSFYAPSTYYLVEGLHWLGLSFYYAFVLAFALLVVVAGVGMAWLARDIFGPSRPWAALVAGVAYVYAPYLLTNVYIRGALAEVGAQALLPWILWSARRLLRTEQPSRYVLPLMLTLGGLAITHNITLLFTPPLLIGYGALHWLQGGRSRRALVWFAVALLGAMGISAFFWLPLLVERGYLAATAYDIAKSVWLPGSVWHWDNFLDSGFFFTHTFARPIRLGLVQLLLAVGGFALARRWTAEWIFFGGVALITGALMGAWALPLWLSNDILPVAQFAWRLLSILSLTLALFVGGLVWRLRDALALVGAALVIMLVIVAQRPQLAWMDVFAADTVDLSAPVFAQVEVDKGVLGGGEGNSSIQEFRPRWAPRTLELDPASVDTAGDIADIALHTISSRGLWATVVADAPATLRLSQFYYPGWRVLLDEAVELLPYPSTNLGLLTVDLPAGRHDLRLEWVGTPAQRGAGLVSLLALLVAIVIGWQTRARFLALLCCLPLTYGLATQWVAPAATPVTAPQQTLATDALRLVGYGLEPVEGGRLAIHPIWHVTATPPTDLRLAWRIGDAAGAPIATTVAQPYFNTTPADLWAPNSLVNDAYLLPVPPGLPAGSYQIAAGFVAAQGETPSEFTPLGEFDLTAPLSPQAEPQWPTSVRFADKIELAGYTTTPSTPADGGAGHPPLLVLEAGEYLHYKLFWRALTPLEVNYHAFVHLVDHIGQPLVQEDQLPGPFFQPPRLWDTTRLQPDVYLLRIPNTAPSALYWPSVGLYDFDTLERLPASTAASGPSVDAARLPPVKIVNRRAPKPAVEQEVQIGDFGVLLGYDLAAPAGGLKPGSMLTVTLTYQARQPIAADYVRFVQLYAPEHGVIAQEDAPPRRGGNPTWSWQPGEIIVDEVNLKIDAQAPPGIYTLYMGMYAAEDATLRVPLMDAEGVPLADGWAPLVDLDVTASP